MNLEDLQTVSHMSFDWAKIDYTSLEKRVCNADTLARWGELYQCKPVDESRYEVKHRYPGMVCDYPQIVNWSTLIKLVQPITATGVNELHNLKVDHVAFTAIFRITRVN